MDAHRVLPNAWVGTTTIFEKEIIAFEESSKIAHVRTAWADMDSGDFRDEDLNPVIARVNERRLVKGSVSSLGVSARRLVKGSLSALRGCRAAVPKIPRAGTEAANSSHVGGLWSPNDWVRSTGNWCLSKRGIRVASVRCRLLTNPRVVFVSEYPEPSFRPRPVHEISSDSQSRGRGGVSRLARIFWQTRPARHCAYFMGKQTR